MARGRHGALSALSALGSTHVGSMASLKALTQTQTQRSASGTSGASGTKGGAVLYAHQATLPRLPVPSLDETGTRYLRSVRPLVDDAAFARTSAAVADFVRPGGTGAVLQQRLLARAQAPEHASRSWLIDWWNDYAYMSYRDPVVINVNYFF
eukprot:jgi/Hompol1/5817/HPOL_002125-RA